MNDIVTFLSNFERQRPQFSFMNDTVNDKKGHSIVNDSFAHKPDGLLVLSYVVDFMIDGNSLCIVCTKQMDFVFQKIWSRTRTGKLWTKDASRSRKTQSKGNYRKSKGNDQGKALFKPNLTKPNLGYQCIWVHYPFSPKKTEIGQV